MHTNNSEYHAASYPLLPGEKLISMVDHPPRVRTIAPSSLREILRLTRSHNPEEIGSNGPAVAALAFEDSASLTPDHLKLYEVLFGRDSLRVAIDLVPSYPELARATTQTLAALQGVSYHIQREEEPGRIVHEARDPEDPIAQELTGRLRWEWPYYGSVDATPEFIRTLTAYCQKSEENRAFLRAEYIDRNGQTQTISRALERALEWIAMRRSKNPEGLLEFKSSLPLGIENQVWKDSWDAYHHSDGRLANHTQGIASIEVQVTTYDALIDAAELFEDILDDTSYAHELRSQADSLKKAILTYFWVDEKGGYFALGTDRTDDGSLRQLKVRTSNMGHTLNSRLLKGNDPTITRMRESTVNQVLGPQLLAPSGIRTLAKDEMRFRPGAYHNGSVWLWDTHHIAKGLRRLGYTNQADDLDRRILHVVEETKLFPEYVRGDNDETPHINNQTIVLYDEIYRRENKIEQPPQEVQAWTVAAILATKSRLKRKPTP